MDCILQENTMTQDKYISRHTGFIQMSRVFR